ncbi:MAG TPA: bifunctional riboflavin kinase/FAD synthetase [bacterium]|nr:bifunctional riboflavin kinase/FAD synthetase [bacterium]
MKSLKSRVVTIGVFDGVHLGHQALIAETVRLARRLKAAPEALTFQDHPAHVLRGGPRVPFLLSREETYQRLKHYGIRRVRVARFTRVFSKKSPEQFVRWLRSFGPLRGVVVGRNFRFGRGAQGDLNALESLGKKYGFEVRGLSPVKVLGAPASSTRVRRLLAEGKTGEANRVLGRPYALVGKVVPGKKLGRRIGFPTANLKARGDYLPKDGVYACAVKIGGKLYRAGMNLGKRPTFQDDDHHRQAEVHLMRYYGSLYGKTLAVYLLKYLRPEKKFPSPKALVAQIKKDLKAIERLPLRGLSRL